MSQKDFKITNPSANQVLVYSEIQKAFINVEPSQAGTGNSIEGGINLGSGVAVFNDTQSGNMRFKTLISGDGISVDSQGSHVRISFDGDAKTLDGLTKDRFLLVGENLKDVDASQARMNLDVYSTQQADDLFLEANATNIPDNDNVYDLGSNGRRFADIYAVTFRGTATNAIISQDLEQKGATDGQVLTWDSLKKGWVPKNALSNRLGDLIDVDLSNIENESVIVFNSSRNIWEALPLSSIGGGGGNSGGGGGTITDAENVGGGVGSFFTRFGGNLQFRSITGGSNVSVTTNFNNEEIVIDADVPATTDALPEGSSNLYFTKQRVENVLSDVSIQDLGRMPSSGPSSNQSPVWNGTRWDFRNVAVDINTTDDLSEGNQNLYFTQDRAFDAIDEYIIDGTQGIRLQDLKDTNVSLSSGTYLYNDGSRWINRAILVSDIADINLTGLSHGSSLVYNANNSRFEIGVLPQRLIDLQESPDSLHFSQGSFDTFLGAKTADDIAESANRKFLNTTNLRNALSTVSIGDMNDVDLSNIADNSVLIWDSARSAFVTASASALNVTVDMGIQDLNNVSESSVLNAQEGYALLYNSVTDTFEAKDPTQNMADLKDVSAGSIQSGDVLMYQSGTFSPAAMVPYDNTVSATNGAILQYDTASGKYVPTASSGFGVSELNDLSDVLLTSISNENVLVYDETLNSFVNRDVSEVVNIESLGGVSLTGLQVNDALIYDGVNFVNVQYPNFELQSLSDGDVVQYDQSSGKFGNVSPYEALNINYQTPSAGDTFVFNSATNQFDVRTLGITDMADVSASPSGSVDNAAHGLVWNESTGQYVLSDLNTVLTIASLSDVSVSDQEDGATLTYNSTTGLYEVRQALIGDHHDVDLQTPSDGETLVWDSSAKSGEGAYVGGLPGMAVQDLSNVSLDAPQDGEGIVWSEEEQSYVSVKLDISYETIIRNSGAIEFWNFDTTLAGAIEAIELEADESYTDYSVAAIGVKGSPSAEAGTSYEPDTNPVANILSVTELETIGLEEANEFSFDFWFQPSSNVAYNTSQRNNIVVASMGLRADTMNEKIAVQVLIAPTSTAHEHRIAVVKNGIEVDSVALEGLNEDSFNYIAVNYVKGAGNTTVEYAVNGKFAPLMVVNDFISDDEENTLFVEALGEMESGSRPYRLDNLAVYGLLQSETAVEAKYKNVVSTGFTYAVPSILDLKTVDVSNVAAGDILRYNGVNFVNEPGIRNIGDLDDVDMSTIADGATLQWDGMQFQPTVLDIPANIEDLDNVDISGIANGQVLQWNGSDFEPATIEVPKNVTELDDVDVDGIATGQVLYWDGDRFIPHTIEVLSTVEDLEDVDVSNIASGQVLQWDGDKFVPYTIQSGGATSLAELNDIDEDLAPADGQTLIFNSVTGKFEAGTITGGGTGGSGAESLNELSDVNTTGQATGSVLGYNGSIWVATTIDYNDLANAPTPFSGSYNDLTDTPDVFSGDYADLTGTPVLSSVATSGSYADLTGTPVLSSVATSGSYADLTGTPDLFSGSYNDLSDKPTIPGTLSDLVDITAFSDGETLVYNADTGQFEPGVATGGSGDGAANLNELNDVNTSGQTEGDVLRYTGGEWVAASIDYADIDNVPNVFSGSYNDLTDAPVLADVATSGNYGDLTGAPTVPSDVSDLVDTSDFSDGQTLVFDSSTGGFVAGNASGGANELNDLTDVDTSGQASGNVMKFDGNVWKAAAVDYAEIANAPAPFSGSYNDLTDTPDTFSGDYADLNGTPNLSSVATSGSYNDLSDTPALADVATSGSYNDLTDTPDTFSGDYADLNGTPDLSSVATSGSYNDLSDTPALADVATSGSYNDLSDAPAIPNAIEDLSNIDTAGVTDGDVLVYDASSSTFKVGAVSGGGSGGATSLNELSDVDTVTTTPAVGDTLVWNGTIWVPKPVEPPMPTGGVTVERFRMNFTATNRAAGAVGTSEPYTEMTSRILPTLTIDDQEMHIFTNIKFIDYQFPPASILFYGWQADIERFKVTAFSPAGNAMISDLNGDPRNPDVFGNFSATGLDILTTRQTFGLTHKMGLPAIAGWGYAVFVMQG